MSPSPIRVEYRGQIYTLDFDDSDVLDLDVVKAQVYSLTNLMPNQQCYHPELNVENLHQIFKLEELESDADNDIDSQIVLSSLEWKSCCTRIWLGDTPAVQPSVCSGGLQICLPCASSCWPQVGLQFNSSTRGFSCQCEDRCLFKARVSSKNEVLAKPFQRFLVQALLEQKNQYDQAIRSRGNATFNDRIQSNLRQIADFEDPDNQQRALSVIPLNVLLQRAEARGAQALSPRDELVFQLLHWFKTEFFQWVNSPACERCGKETSASGHAAPLPDERRYGAGVVELHKCGSCGSTTRFPRYNHSGKLMETRKGRCGEWAQAFVLCCRALKFDCRFVVDWTDHVWAEVYSDAKQRWVHCDPCENRYDSPLLYEAGWGKKLTYVIAFSVDEVRDVTRRYTAKYEEVLYRRTACQEEWLRGALELLNDSIQSRNSARRPYIQQRWAQELQELHKHNSTNSDECQSNLPGRQTGSTEWRRARGELGNVASDEDSSKKTVPMAHLQNLARAYFAQMMTGCGKPDCKNKEYCSSAHESTVNGLSQKDILAKSIVAVRDFMDSKLCSRSDKS